MITQAEITPVLDAAQRLQQAYLSAGIVTPKWSTDALHDALATVSNCELIVSWNLKHIVHFEKIPLYNAVNTCAGYDAVAIYSSWEVIRLGDNREEMG